MAITVEIDEGRRSEASFSGIKAFSEGDLRPLLTFQRSGFFDDEEVAAGRERILAFYQERGWYLAEVDARADYEAGHVVYVVRENHPVPVAEVRLVGFTHFGADWLRQRLDTRPSSGEVPHLLQTPLLERDRLRIRSLYRDAGFTRVEVPPPEVWPEAGPAGAVVIFTVREGPRTLLRSVSFAGAGALSREQLLAATRFEEGAPFREADLKPAVDRVRAAYARIGYSQCAVTVRPDFGVDRTRVDLRFTVTEGRRRRLGVVAVTGNARTRRRVILRELPLAPGDPLDPEALAKGKSELYDLGLFREVRYVLPEPVSPGGPQDLVLAVRERPTGFVGFGVGYSSDERFRGFVEAGEQNLFGTARSLRWKTKVSEIGYRHDLFYQEPWLFDYRLQGQADLYLESQEETGYKVRREGLALGANREFTPAAAAQPALPLRARGLFERRPGSHGRTRSPGELQHRQRRPRGSPTTAATTRSSRGGAPTSWRASRWRGRSSAATSRSPNTSSNPCGSCRSGTAPKSPSGCAAGSRSCSSAPRISRFPSGFSSAATAACAATATRAIGPKDAAGNPLGGNAFALGNVELRFSVYKKLRGVFFFDAGELWADQAGLPPSGVKTSVGTGIRYETLVGPIRLDWGYKLKPEPGESPSRWHLTIGYPF